MQHPEGWALGFGAGVVGGGRGGKRKQLDEVSPSEIQT